MTMGGVVEVDDSGMLFGEERMPLWEETSRGPDDKLDNNILAMRSWAGESAVRAGSRCNADARWFALRQGRRRQSLRCREQGLEAAAKKAVGRVEERKIGSRCVRMSSARLRQSLGGRHWRVVARDGGVER